MRRLLLALPLVLAAPVLADSGPQRIRISEPAAAPGAAAPLPWDPASVKVVLTQGSDGRPTYTVSPASALPQVAAAWPGARVVAAPEPAKAEEDVSPATLEYRERCRLLEERGIGRGDEVGGNGAFGMRLGGKGQADQLGDVDPAVLRAVDEWNEQGALILSVVPGSPTETAGLEPGDIVVQIAGIWIDTPNMLVRIASRAEVGRELELRFLREGDVQSTWLSAVDRKELSRLQP